MQDLNRDANVVYVPYCSSDGWMGDAEFAGWEMRGRDIVMAVLDDVFGDAAPSTVERVVFGGGSAGGRGAMVLLDSVAARLQELVDGVEVVGFLDSPYYSVSTPLDTPDGTFEGFRQQTIDVFHNFVELSEHAEAILGKECSAAYPGEAWKCLFGEFRLPFVKTKYLVVGDQFDGWQLSHNVHDYDGIESSPVFSKDEVAAVSSFGAQQHALLGLLPSKANDEASVVFATSCYSHHISEGVAYFEVKNKLGVSQADAVRMVLLEGSKGGTESWVDELPNEFECCCVK